MKRARIEYNGDILDVTVNEDGSVLTPEGKNLGEDQVTWLPPGDHVTCMALNYKGHVAQVESTFHEPPHKQPPKNPVLFFKTPNTLTGHRAKVQCPDGADFIQPGPSLALVIGKEACRVKPEDAFDYIGGYTLVNDFTLPELSYYRPPIVSKGYDSFGPVGPYVVDAGDVEDPSNLAVRTYVNGEVRQAGNTRDLVWDIPAALSFITHIMTLPAGAIIATGFPEGRVDVRPGDEVVIEVEGVGRLQNQVVTESEYFADAE